METSDLRGFLRLLAEESARVILPLFADPDLKVEWKADHTPVTYADRKAEEVMRELIGREFPSHGIVGEELGEAGGDAEYSWVLDPIDGTRAFAAGCPLFGTLICLRKGTTPLWGAIHLPVTRQLFIGDNRSSWCNDRPLRLPKPPPLAAAFLCTSDACSPRLQTPERAAGWQALLARCGQFRTWGDCYGYGLLLQGGIHIMTDPILNLWDLVALLPILRGAGALATDWQGGEPDSGDSLVAAHPDLQPLVVACLNQAAPVISPEPCCKQQDLAR